jgi:hypothetical protein
LSHSLSSFGDAEQCSKKVKQDCFTGRFHFSRCFYQTAYSVGILLSMIMRILYSTIMLSPQL